MSGVDHLDVVVVEQLHLVARRRECRSCPAARAPAVLDRKMWSASVDADPVEHGLAEALLKRRCRSAGSDSPAVTVERTEPNIVAVDVGVEQGGDEAGAGEEQRGSLGGHQLGHAGGRRAGGVEDGGGAHRQRERQRVAEAVGEEQLGDRKAPVVGPDVRAPTWRRSSPSPRGWRAGASRPWACRSCPSCRARTPASRPWWRRRAPRGDRRTRQGRGRARGRVADAVGRGVAEHHGGAQLRSGRRRSPAGRPRRRPRPRRRQRPASADDGGQLAAGEHRRQRHRDDARAEARRGTRRGRQARR